MVRIESCASASMGWERSETRPSIRQASAALPSEEAMSAATSAPVTPVAYVRSAPSGRVIVMFGAPSAMGPSSRKGG